LANATLKLLKFGGRSEENLTKNLEKFMMCRQFRIPRRLSIYILRKSDIGFEGIIACPKCKNQTFVFITWSCLVTRFRKLCKIKQREKERGKLTVILLMYYYTC